MATETITFTATFTGGSGSITFMGVEGLAGDKTLICDLANPVSPQTFTADQTPGNKDPQVTGTAPAAGGIQVDVTNSAGKNLVTNTYKNQFVGADLDYTV